MPFYDVCVFYIFTAPPPFSAPYLVETSWHRETLDQNVNLSTYQQSKSQKFILFRHRLLTYTPALSTFLLTFHFSDVFGNLQDDWLTQSNAQEDDQFVPEGVGCKLKIIIVPLFRDPLCRPLN